MAIKKKSLIDRIKTEALLENAELKDNNLYGHYISGADKAGQRGAEIIKNNDFQPFFHKHVAHLYDEPVSLKTFVNFDPDVIATAGWYTIKYVPAKSKYRVKNRPYQIGQDLVHFRVCVSGPKYWHVLCERIPELAWIQRWSYLTDDLFKIAAQHPGMSFYFTVDWVRYAKMIEEKAKAKGIDIDDSPFVTYMTTEEKLAELNSTYLLAPERGNAEYRETVDKVDSEFGQEEEVVI